MKINKIISGMLSFCIAGAGVPVSETALPDFSITAEAAETGTYGALTYSNYGNYIKITGCDESAEGEIEIPSEIDGVPVTSIGSAAFSWNESLTSVLIPDSVTSIENFAFSNCTGLTSVTIPDSVTSIGYLAFSGCSGLTSITISESVRSIEYDAFSDCISLTAINVSESNPVFSDDGGILFNKEKTELKCYPAGIKNIEYSIPDSVTSIEDWAFSYCTGLTSITIPDSVLSIGERAFYGCTGLTSITIPNNVPRIEYGTFYGCTGLTSVTIGDSVTSIGVHAFFDCISLTAINVSENNPVFSDDGGILFNKDKTELKCYPVGIENSEYSIPDGVTSIGDSAFSACRGLTSITIPDSVTSIKYAAFVNCSGLTSITVPDSVTSIENWAFSACTGLTSITIENPDCEIYDSSNCISNDRDNDTNEYYFNGTIYGYENSTAQAYAEKYDRNFVSVVYGDINDDGFINPSDATLVLMQYVAESLNDSDVLSSYQKLCADVNSDGFINPTDATLILNYYSYFSIGAVSSFEDFIANQ